MTDSLSLDGNASRFAQLLREKDEKRVQERRSNLLYLIVKFLEEQGYWNSANTLFKEALLSKSTQVCDNIDLETIVEEYTDYYYAKFNRYPKFCRKTESGSTGNLANATKIRKGKTSKDNREASTITANDKSAEETNVGKAKLSQKSTNCATAVEPSFEMTVTQILPPGSSVQPPTRTAPNEHATSHEKTLKPIGHLYPIGSEWREIAELISREIVLKDLNVRWSDIKGLQKCKACLKEAAVYPIKYPVLFNGKFSPWGGVLLYGPPGTGKTMLAKAVATECQCTFFNITSSSIISKWRGDSEKYVRVLLELAHYYSPTIIFIDEIDWIATKDRDVSSTCSEPARRFRAELLARLDGLLSVENSNVMLLASTNVPWSIDTALLRRLERRIFVGLPDEESRQEILQYYVKEDLHYTDELYEVVMKTTGYSCADLKLLCKEAWMKQMQKFWTALASESCRVEDIEKDHINEIFHLTDAMELVQPLTGTVYQYVQWSKNFSLSK